MSSKVVCCSIRVQVATLSLNLHISLVLLFIDSKGESNRLQHLQLFFQSPDLHLYFKLYLKQS